MPQRTVEICRDVWAWEESSTHRLQGPVDGGGVGAGLPADWLVQLKQWEEGPWILPQGLGPRDWVVHLWG